LGRVNDDDTHSTCCDAAASAAVTSASSILLKHWSEEDVKAANLQIDFAEIIFKAQIAVDVRNGLAFVGQLPHFRSRAFSHDGSSLLYLPDTTIVAVLDVHTLAERLRLVGHADEIMWAETSPNDKVVATSSWDRTVRIWSMKSGEILHILEGSAGQSWSGAFSPDGELVAAGDKMVRIWRVDTGELLYTFSGFQGWVRTLAFSPDGLHLAAGSFGGTLKVFNVKSGETEQSWNIEPVNGHGGGFLEIRNMQYTSRGDLFFSSTEGRIFGYRASGNLTWEFFEPGSPGAGVTTSEDGSKLIARLGSSVCIWEIK
jgi:WD40 repeat protein